MQMQTLCRAVKISITTSYSTSVKNFYSGLTEVFIPSPFRDYVHEGQAGGVGHDSQSVPGEFFARAHFHLIAEGQTSPRVEGEVEIM